MVRRFIAVIVIGGSTCLPTLTWADGAVLQPSAPAPQQTSPKVLAGQASKWTHGVRLDDLSTEGEVESKQIQRLTSPATTWSTASRVGMAVAAGTFGNLGCQPQWPTPVPSTSHTQRRSSSPPPAIREDKCR